MQFKVIQSVRRALINIRHLSQHYYTEYKEKGLKKFWNENIVQSNDHPSIKIRSIMLGIFIGLIPFWGLQTVIVLVLASVLRLNKVIALLCSYISVPPMIPFIIYASYQLGAIVMTGAIDIKIHPDALRSADDLVDGLEFYVIGSFILASSMTILSGGIAFVYFRIMMKKR